MDAVAEWAAAYQRVRSLAAGLDDSSAAATVPACPDWTVQNLLAHMIGLGVDVLAGDEPEDHNASWTQRQVDQRAGRSIDELLAEWDSVAGPLQDWMRANNPRPLGDVIIHEQDLRGALGVPGGQDTPGLHAIRDSMLGRFEAKLAQLPDLDARTSIALVGERFEWCSAGPAHQAAVIVRAPDFELARALMSRRSAAQVRAWTARGDVEAYLPAFETLGPLPARGLTE